MQTVTHNTGGVRPLLVESSFMVTQVLIFWIRDAVIIWFFPTKFTVSVNLVILALTGMLALKYFFTGVLF